MPDLSTIVVTLVPSLGAGLLALNQWVIRREWGEKVIASRLAEYERSRVEREVFATELRVERDKGMSRRIVEIKRQLDSLGERVHALELNDRKVG